MVIFMLQTVQLYAIHGKLDSLPTDVEHIIKDDIEYFKLIDNATTNN